MELKPVAFASIESCLPDNGQAFQMEASAHMMQILSNRIYTDKVGAVVRELSCNANDSHIAARTNPNWKARPFVINVPTAMEPVFYVEDFGTGIPHEKIADIYWSYGKSTKTQDNLQTGALGLGSKSPFAYTESFVVRNRFNGLEVTYFCAPNAKGIPMGHEVGRCDTTESNGVRVELAVKASDIHAFRTSLIRFFSYWDAAMLPEFKNDSRIAEEVSKYIGGVVLSGDDWYIRKNGMSGAIALMGNVPYAINAQNHVHACTELKAICKTNTVMVFKMGEVSFTPSREELEYDPDTLAILNARAKVVTASVLASISSNLDGVYEFPHQLMTELDNRSHKLARTFSSVVEVFRDKEFTLKDGRIYSFNQLKKLFYKSLAFTWPGRNDIVVFETENCRVQRANGMQYKKLAPQTQLEISHKLVSESVPWFPTSTKPVVQPIGSTRARTVSNLLAEGFVVTDTTLELSKHITSVIINDLGTDGETAFKFWDNNTGRPYFVNGDYANKTPQETFEFIKSLYYNTSLEGQVSIQFLSKMSNFALNKAATTPVPRKSIERGTVALECNTHGYNRHVNIHTQRVDYQKPIYFAHSLRGSLTNPIEENVLKLLNKVDTGKTWTVAYLTPTNEKMLAAKNATLIDVSELRTEFDGMITPKFIEVYSKFGFYADRFDTIQFYARKAKLAGSKLFVDQVAKLNVEVQQFKNDYRVELQLINQFSTKSFGQLPNYEKFKQVKPVSFFVDFPNIDEMFKSQDNSRLPIVMILACEKIKGHSSSMFP